MDNIWANLPETRPSRAHNAAATSADMQPGSVSGEGLRLSVTRVKLLSTEQEPGEECQKSQVNRDALYQGGRNLVSTTESSPDSVMNCQLPATAWFRANLPRCVHLHTAVLMWTSVVFDVWLRMPIAGARRVPRR